MVDFVLFNVNVGLNYTLFINCATFIIENPIYLHIIT
jgi:hypothetical protein